MPGDLTGLNIPESLNAFVAEALASGQEWYRFDTKQLPSAKQIEESTGDDRKSLAMDLCRMIVSFQKGERARKTSSDADADRRVLCGAKALFATLIRSHLKFTDADIVELLRVAVRRSSWAGLSMAGIVSIVERYGRTQVQLPPTLRDAVVKLYASLQVKRDTSDISKLRTRLARLLGMDKIPDVLKRGEPWADLVVDDLKSLALDMQLKWTTLLSAAKSASGSSPTKKYIATSRKLAEDIGLEEFQRRFRQWSEVAGAKSLRTPHPLGREGTVEQPLDCDNANVLRGLVWAAAATGDASLAPSLGNLAERCYKKLPWYGPKSAKVGNACVAALAMLDGDEPAAQLAKLKQRVKQPTGRKMTEKALGRFADRAGLSTDEVEERGVASFGLDAEGARRDVFGEFIATTSVVSGEVAVEWIGPDGKIRKSLPSTVKTHHAAAHRELQSLHKQIKASLLAQRSRLEQLLLQQRSWPLAQWRKLYLDHPLLSALVRRLIWRVGNESAVAANGGIFNVTGDRLAAPETATVTPWHPAMRSTGEVLAWRTRLESLGITQPFKQAHREIYLLFSSRP